MHPADRAEDQGESDASPERAPVYARLFETTIGSWRRAWGAALRVHLDNASGLTTRGGAPAVGFEVAGPDGRYVPAQARIEGSTVVVSSPDVKTPRSVR